MIYFFHYMKYVYIWYFTHSSYFILFLYFIFFQVLLLFSILIYILEIIATISYEINYCPFCCGHFNCIKTKVLKRFSSELGIGIIEAPMKNCPCYYGISMGMRRTFINLFKKRVPRKMPRYFLPREDSTWVTAFLSFLRTNNII